MTPTASQERLSEKLIGGGIAALYRGNARFDDQKRIGVLVSENGSILAVAKKLKLSQAYLSQILSGKRRASNRYRCALGLRPLTAPAPVCPKCSVVHVTKRCTARKPARRPKSLFDWPVSVLASAIGNRK